MDFLDLTGFKFPSSSVTLILNTVDGLRKDFILDSFLPSFLTLHIHNHHIPSLSLSTNTLRFLPFRTARQSNSSGILCESHWK